MKEIPTPVDPLKVQGIDEVIADAKSAVKQLPENQQQVIFSLFPKAMSMVLDGLDLEEIMRRLEDGSPEAKEAMDALSKIP